MRSPNQKFAYKIYRGNLCKRAQNPFHNTKYKLNEARSYEIFTNENRIRIQVTGTSISLTPLRTSFSAFELNSQESVDLQSPFWKYLFHMVFYKLLLAVFWFGIKRVCLLFLFVLWISRQLSFQKLGSFSCLKKQISLGIQLMKNKWKTMFFPTTTTSHA